MSTTHTRSAPAHHQAPPAVERFKRHRRVQEMRQRVALVGETFSRSMCAFPEPIDQEEVERLLKMGNRRYSYPADALIEFSWNYGVPIGWLLLGDMSDLLVHARRGFLAYRGETFATWYDEPRPAANLEAAAQLEAILTRAEGSLLSPQGHDVTAIRNVIAYLRGDASAPEGQSEQNALESAT